MSEENKAAFINAGYNQCPKCQEIYAQDSCLYCANKMKTEMKQIYKQIEMIYNAGYNAAIEEAAQSCCTICKAAENIRKLKK